MATFEASASELMKRLLPLLIAALATPVAASANHHEKEALLERATLHKVVYLLWKIGDEIRKVPPLPSAKWSQVRGCSAKHLQLMKKLHLHNFLVNAWFISGGC